uniref:NADH dehydrogenase subunit 6 n=1 Tax=Taeniothrips eucharii TaxID=1818613 RepID=UPI0030E3DCEE
MIILKKMIFKMMDIILMLLFFLSIMSMLLTLNPFTMSFMVILQSLITSMMLMQWFKSSFLSMFIFIVYLGGILMLFLYIMSVTYSKENFKMPKLSLMSMLTIFFISDKDMSKPKMYLENFIQPIYSSSMKMSIFLLVILLILMIMVTFMTDSSKGNMRII